MKRLAIALLPILMFSCHGVYTITGEAPEGSSAVVLSKLVGKNPVPVDTADVGKDGSFCFKGFTEKPFVAYLVDAETGEAFTDLCVSGADIYVNHGEYGYQVVGGEENARFNSIRESLFEEELTPKQMYIVMDSAIMENPSCTAYSYILFRQLYNKIPLVNVEELEARFSDEVRGNCYLTILRELIAQTRLSMPGNPELDFSSTTPSGDTLSLSSLKGKWVLLDFWASWCPYCRKENPQLVGLYDRFHSEGFEILSVSLDSDRDQWLKAINEDSLTWLHVSDLDRWECKPARMYGISAIPGNVLISPEGTIAARQLHEDNLTEKLYSIFKR